MKKNLNPSSDYSIEICIDSLDSALAAREGGARHVELCSALIAGGLTPGLGLVRLIRKQVPIELNVILRPRGGDFLYTPEEYAVMKEDAKILKEEGADGIVFGFLNEDGTVDEERSREILDITKGLRPTFHRAFDVSRDPEEALETVIKLGFDRILSSGTENTVLEGAEVLKNMIDRAGDRILIMPGGGITARNFPRIHRLLGARSYHMSLSEGRDSRMHHRSSRVFMGGALRAPEFLNKYTSADLVKSVTGCSPATE